MSAALVLGVAGGAWAWTDHRDGVAAQQAAATEHSDDVAQAQDADSDDLRVLDADAASLRTAAVLAQARTDLQHGVDSGTATLAATEGTVVDDTVRQALAQQLAAVGVALAPAATGLSASALRATTGALAAAEAAVVAAHEAWVQQAAAQAAASAAKAATKAPKPATTPKAPSCGTTYSGPPFYTSPPTVGGDGTNGKLPPSALAAISWATDPHGTPYYLRTDAAAALERLDGAFRAAFGHHLGLDLTYRDYDTQVAMRAALGSVAATPGTSTHGTGLALDVPELPCEYGWDTPQRDWLVAHGPSYGWTSPSWARQNGSNPEYWHFDYVG